MIDFKYTWQLWGTNFIRVFVWVKGRDSEKWQDAGMLVFTPEEWEAFQDMPHDQPISIERDNEQRSHW